MGIDNYLYGECHLFALALKQEYGYPIVLALDKFDLETKGELLIHDYCVDGGAATHANGKIRLTNVRGDYDYTEP